MFRVLPYVIIFAFAVFIFKVMKTIEDIVPIIHIEDLLAASDKKIQNKDNKEIDKQSADKKEAVDPKKTTSKQNNKQDGVNYTTPQYTLIEVEILKGLSKRRKKIAIKEKEVDLKEVSLNIIEERIQARIDKLSKLQVAINKILKEYEEHEKNKNLDLVKIYESMKPPDAARIFEQLQMEILISLAEDMKKTKLAAIMAQMNPVRAKEITVELTKHRKLNLSKFK